MKSLLRYVTVGLVLLLLAGPALGRASAQEPDPKYDATFAQAKRLEAAGTPDKAYDEYIHIKNDNSSKDPDLAADALLRAALLGYNALAQPLSPDVQKLPAEERQIREDKQVDLARKSHDALKQMKDDPRLQDSPAGRYVLAQNWENIQNHQPADLKTALESQIDYRNSRQFSYQLIDHLVRLTGAIPGFSYWFALVLIALIVKTITFPLTMRTYKSQREMQRVQPMMKALQEKYKGKPELNEKMMEFYKEHKVNPFASCFPMLVQMPFMYWVYYAIRSYEYHFSNGKFLWIGSSLSHAYPSFLATDLAKFDIPLLVLYGLSNYLTMYLNPSPDPAQAAQQKQMSLMMTITFFFIFMKYQWSAAFIFYWLVLNFINAFQQYNYIFKPNRVKAAESSNLPNSDRRGPEESGGGVLATARPVTPIPGGTAARPRPKARKRK